MASSPKRAGPAREPEPTEDPVPAGTRPAARWGDRAALGLLPAGVAVAFGALLVFQPGPPEADLQLVAPGSTAPGASLGVRAFVFHDLEAPSGPSLIGRGAVHLSLGPPEPRDAGPSFQRRDPWVRARMAATPLDTFEASVELPPDLPLGPAVLVARSDQVERVTRLPIVLARAPDPVALRLRELPRLARFRAGPLRPASARGRPPDSGETADAGPGGPPMPVPFEVRVPGGACVPEIPCTLLVHVGAPAAAVTLDLGSGRAVEEHSPPTPAGEVSGVVEVEILIHGPEASIGVVAVRSGRPVAERRVRLPVAVGAPRLHLEGSRPASPTLVFEGVEGREAALVDVYRDGRWEQATSVSLTPDDAGRAAVPWPGPPLAPGVLRIQAQVDRFELGLAATRLHPVPDPAPGDPAAGGVVAPVSRYLRELDERRGTASAAAGAGVVPPFADDAGRRRAVAFALAPAESLVAVPPPARSNRAAHAARAAQTRDQLRQLVAALFLLAGVWVASWIGRRGLRASREADRLLRDARSPGREGVPPEAAVAPLADGSMDAWEDPPPDPDGGGTRRRAWLEVLGLCALVGFAFVAGALVVLALGSLER